MKSTIERNTMSQMDDDIRIEKNSLGQETYVFDPYNPLNKQISKNDIISILKKYGIDAPIYNYELYKQLVFLIG